MSIDREINARVDAYRNNPSELKKKYSVSKELVDLLALQKIKKNMDAERNNIALQMQTDPSTIKSQLENEVRTRTAQDVAKQLGGVFRNKQVQQQKGLNRLAQRAAAPKGPQGLGALMPQQGQRPQTRMMQEGGIVAFNEGDLVEAPTSLGDLPDKSVTSEQLRDVARAQIKQLLEGGVSPQTIKQELPPQFVELVDEVVRTSRATAPAGMMEEVVVTAPREPQTPAVNPLSAKGMAQKQEGIAQLNEQNITTRDVPKPKTEPQPKSTQTPRRTGKLAQYAQIAEQAAPRPEFNPFNQASKEDIAEIIRRGLLPEGFEGSLSTQRAEEYLSKPVPEGTAAATKTPVVPMENIERTLGLGGQGEQTPPPTRQPAQTGIAQGQSRPSVPERFDLQGALSGVGDAPAPTKIDRTNLNTEGLERLKQLGMDPTTIDVEQAGADARKAAETYYGVAGKDKEARKGLEAILNLDESQTSPEELRRQQLMSFLLGGQGKGRLGLAGAGAAAENTRRRQQRDIRARQVERNEMLNEIQRKDNELRKLAKADERSALDRANQLKTAGLNYLSSASAAELQARIAEAQAMDSVNSARFQSKLKQIELLLQESNSAIDQFYQQEGLASADKTRQMTLLNSAIDSATKNYVDIATAISEVVEVESSMDPRLQALRADLDKTNDSARRAEINKEINARSVEIAANVQVRLADLQAQASNLLDDITRLGTQRDSLLDYNIGQTGESLVATYNK